MPYSSSPCPQSAARGPTSDRSQTPRSRLWARSWAPVVRLYQVTEALHELAFPSCRWPGHLRLLCTGCGCAGSSDALPRACFVASSLLLCRPCSPSSYISLSPLRRLATSRQESHAASAGPRLDNLLDARRGGHTTRNVTEDFFHGKRIRVEVRWVVAGGVPPSPHGRGQGEGQGEGVVDLQRVAGQDLTWIVSLSKGRRRPRPHGLHEPRLPDHAQGTPKRRPWASSRHSWPRWWRATSSIIDATTPWPFLPSLCGHYSPSRHVPRPRVGRGNRRRGRPAPISRRRRSRERSGRASPRHTRRSLQSWGYADRLTNCGGVAHLVRHGFLLILIPGAIGHHSPSAAREPSLPNSSGALPSLWGRCFGWSEPCVFQIVRRFLPVYIMSSALDMIVELDGTEFKGGTIKPSFDGAPSSHSTVG